MMLYIGAICGLVLGGIAGWYLRERYAMFVVRQMIQEGMVKMPHAPDVNAVPVKAVNKDGMFYFYNANTEEFLAQGRTHEEVTSVLKSRFPNTKFMANPQNLLDIGYDEVGADKNDAV